MSSNNRITDTAIIGPPPSTNGKSYEHAPSPNGSRGAADASPSTNGSGRPAPSADRDDLGRFALGNPGGPGNPFARYVAELRKAAIEAIGREGLKAIFLKMHELALQGNTAAAKFCTSYMIGKPPAATDPDRLDINEWNQMKEEAPMMKEIREHWKTPAPALPLTCMRASRYATTRQQSGMMAVVLGMPSKEQDRLFELGAANPHEVCNLLRDKAKNLGKPPSANGKRKK